jgi:hypothetical protein
MGFRTISFVLLLLAIFLCGCVDTNRGNVSINVTSNLTINTTDANVTQNISPPWPRYSTSAFSFQYPPEMNMSEAKNGSNGLITGYFSQPLSELAIRYVDTLATYGAAKDFDFKTNPTKAASDFLIQGKEQDAMGFFMTANATADISTFTIGTDAFCAELPFTSGTGYGYALTMYIPSRSMFVDVRILAADPSSAKSTLDSFVYGFRLV